MKKHQPRTTQGEKNHFQQLPSLTELKIKQLDGVVGGRLVTPQQGIYVISDTGDPGDP